MRRHHPVVRIHVPHTYERAASTPNLPLSSLPDPTVGSRVPRKPSPLFHADEGLKGLRTKPHKAPAPVSPRVRFLGVYGAETSIGYGMGRGGRGRAGTGGGERREGGKGGGRMGDLGIFVI